MVKGAEWRRRKYEAGVNPEVIGKRFGQVKDVMVELEGEYLAQIAQVEAKVKGLVEAAGIPSYEVAQYLNFAREMWTLSSRFSGVTLAAECQWVVNKWVSRGLTGSLLVGIAKFFGVSPSAPPAPPVGPSPSNTVVSETNYDQAASAGSATTYSRGDHTHGSPVDPQAMLWALIFG